MSERYVRNTAAEATYKQKACIGIAVVEELLGGDLTKGEASIIIADLKADDQKKAERLSAILGYLG